MEMGVAGYLPGNEFKGKVKFYLFVIQFNKRMQRAQLNCRLH